MKENWHAERIEKSEEFWRGERLDPAAAFMTARCVEISGSERRHQEVDVAIEERIEIVLDGTVVAKLFCLPSELEELAVGHLVCEGLISFPEDLVSVKAEGKSVFCESCDRKIEKELRPIDSDLRMSPESIFGAVDQLNEGAHLWRRTGGTHSALILREDGTLASFCEDVSRSSAVDKAVGAALLAGADLSRSALTTTGRLSSVMVFKAARAGIPILVSRAAPLSTGIDLARRLGMTLIAFARRPKLYVYTGDGRISYEE
jgi:FdhD protein